MRLVNLGLVFSMFMSLINPASMTIMPTTVASNEIVYDINNGDVSELGTIPSWTVKADSYGIEMNKTTKTLGLKVKSTNGMEASTVLPTTHETLEVTLTWYLVGAESSTILVSSINEEGTVDSKSVTGIGNTQNTSTITLQGTDATHLKISSEGAMEIHITSVAVKDVVLENGSFTKNMEIPGWVHAGETIATTTIDGKNYITLTDHVDTTVLTKTEKISILNDKLSDFVFEFEFDVMKQSHSVEVAARFYDAKGKEVLFKNLLVKSQAGKGLLKHVLEVEGVQGAASFELIVSSGKVSITEIFLKSVSATQKVSAEPAKPIHETLQNPGFESKDMSNLGWTLITSGGVMEIRNDIKLSGESSLYFEDNQIEGDMDLSAPRIMSDKFKVVAEDDITITANVYAVKQTHNIVLEIYFYDANGTLVQQKQELYSSNSLGVAKWSKMNYLTRVPKNAVSMAIGFYSGQPSLTQAYFDDVLVSVLPKEMPLEREYLEKENLGPMVDVSLGQAAAIGYNAKGELEVYFHSNGLPGTFSVLDGVTGALKFSQVAPGTEAVWGMVIGKDGKVYFASTGDGTLFAYDPILKKMESVGVNPTDQWTWDLEVAEDGKIYGSTYPNAGVWEYDPATDAFRDYGAMVTDADYVRGIAVEGDYVYAATGTTRHLMKLNRHTGEKTEIIIEGHTGTNGFFEDLHIVGDKLMVSSGSVNMLVVDRDTLEVLDSFHYNNNISKPDPNNENLIYFKSNQKFYQYNLETLEKTELDLGVLLPDTARVKDFVWVGEELAFITAYGEYMFFNPQTQSLRFVNLDIAAQPVAIQSLRAGFDGRIYLGGYQRGMSIYNPFTGEKDVNISSFAQPEGIGFLNGKVYYGTYVAAIMYSLDPSLPIDLGNNPTMIHAIGDQQDRPFAITSGDDKLFVGTVPDYGVLGGVLAIYDEPSNTWFQERNVVEDQSIIALEYHDGLLYGGTSIWGGLDANSTQDEAKLFIWDTKTNTKVKEMTLDIPGIDEAPKMIGGLSIGPDGLLWGIVDGTVFAMDLETHEIVKSKMIQPSKYNSSKWLPYEIEFGPDGMLYTTLSRQLTVIDPNTLQHKVLETEFVNHMTLNVDGTIFYSLGTDLYQIRVPETDATLASISVDGNVLETFSPATFDYQLGVDEIDRIEAKATQSGAKVTVNHDKANKVVTITVTASDAISTLTYRVIYGTVAVGDESGFGLEAVVDPANYQGIVKEIIVNVAGYFNEIEENVLESLSSIVNAMNREVKQYLTFSITPIGESGEKIQLRPGAKQAFSMPLPQGYGQDGTLEVYHINKDGTLTLLESEVKDGVLYFYATSFSDFMIVESVAKQTTTPSTPETGGNGGNSQTPQQPNNNNPGNSNGGQSSGETLPETGVAPLSMIPYAFLMLGALFVFYRKKETSR